MDVYQSTKAVFLGFDTLKKMSKTMQSLNEAVERKKRIERLRKLTNLKIN